MLPVPSKHIARPVHLSAGEGPSGDSAWIAMPAGPLPAAAMAAERNLRLADRLAPLVRGHLFGASAEEKADDIILAFHTYLRDLAPADRRTARARLETAIADRPDDLRTLLHLGSTPGHSQPNRVCMRAALLNVLVRSGFQTAQAAKPGILAGAPPLPPDFREAAAPIMPPARSSPLIAALQHAGFPDDAPLIEIDQFLMPFDNGRFNKVYRTELPWIGATAIVKPLEPNEVLGVARSMGIRPPPRFEQRNLASFRLASAIGAHVICQTSPGVVTTPGALKDRLVIVMEQVKGTALAYLPPEAFEDPDLREQVVALQLLDAVLGQGDRHGGNIIVNMSGKDGRVEVSGIDNDQCLGPFPRDPDELPKMPGSRAVLLPPSITRAVATVFRGLSEETLRDILQLHVGADELDAAVARLQCVHRHIDACDAEGRVVEHLAYDDLHGPENSYWARGYHGAIARQGKRRKSLQVDANAFALNTAP